jgi:hypothetical protein
MGEFCGSFGHEFQLEPAYPLWKMQFLGARSKPRGSSSIH